MIEIAKEIERWTDRDAREGEGEEGKKQGGQNEGERVGAKGSRNHGFAMRTSIRRREVSVRPAPSLSVSAAIARWDIP